MGTFSRVLSFGVPRAQARVQSPVQNATWPGTPHSARHQHERDAQPDNVQREGEARGGSQGHGGTRHPAPRSLLLCFDNEAKGSPPDPRGLACRRSGPGPRWLPAATPPKNIWTGRARVCQPSLPLALTSRAGAAARLLAVVPRDQPADRRAGTSEVGLLLLGLAPSAPRLLPHHLLRRRKSSFCFSQSYSALSGLVLLQAFDSSTAPTR